MEEQYQNEHFLSLHNEETFDFKTTEELNWLFETEDLLSVYMNQFIKSEFEIYNEINTFDSTPVSQFDTQNIKIDIEKRSSGRGNWEVEESLPNNIGKFRKVTISLSNFNHLSQIKQIEISVKRMGGFGPSCIYLDYTEGSTTANQQISEPQTRDTLLFDVTSFSSIPPEHRKLTFFIKTKWVKGACPKSNPHPYFTFNINLIHPQLVDDGTEVMFGFNFRSQQITIKPHKWESKDNKKKGIAKIKKTKSDENTTKVTGSKRSRKDPNAPIKRRKTV